MRLFPLNSDIEKVSHEIHGEFEKAEDGGFDLPDEFGHFLHNTHIGGVKVWETDGERSLRLLAEEDARRKDPATLLGAVEDLVKTLVGNAAAPAAPEEPASASKKAAPASKKAAEAPTPAQ